MSKLGICFGIGEDPILITENQRKEFEILANEGWNDTIVYLLKELRDPEKVIKIIRRDKNIDELL